MISRAKNTAKNSQKGQTALEYALVVVVMASVASLFWVFYQGTVDYTFYDVSSTPSMGLEKTLYFPFP